MPAREAFLKSFLKHRSMLYGFVFSMTGDRSEAEDVLQDVAVVLWERFGRYDPSRPFGAWARGIAAKKILQWRAGRRRLPMYLEPEALEAVLRAYDRIEPGSPEKEALRRCLQNLPQKARDLVRLRHERSLSLREIAEHLKSTVGAVHKLLSRIRLKLLDCVRRRLANSNSGAASGKVA